MHSFFPQKNSLVNHFLPLLYFSPKSTNIDSMGVTANSWLQTSLVTLALLIGPRITLRIQVNFFHSMLVYIQFKGSFEKVYKYCFLCTLNVKITFLSFWTLKLNYRKKVFYFSLNFLPWEFLLIKKLEIEKTKTT